MKLKIVKSLLWFFIGAGIVACFARFIHGLGATTNLSDKTPWGLWISFDVMAGVALASGGFVIAGIVYVFNLEKFKPIVKAAVLTAFIGYIADAIGLIFDLGLPWNMWHMIIFWNPGSPLFVIGWCFMIYLTVLFLEFAPVWIEKSPVKKYLKYLRKIYIPLVILGIMISTLHQSSLGSLMLIMPFRLHPLWYSSIMPVIFFISAISLGLMMVVLESIVSGWLYNKKPETGVLAGLGKAAAYILGLYVILKLGDLVFQGKLGLLAELSWESVLFIFELLISAIIPAVLLAIPKIRNSIAGQLSCAVLVVFGFVLNRLNVSGLATISATGTDYFPSLLEIIVSLSIVSGAVLIFFYFVENFRVWETEAKTKITESSHPSFDAVTTVWNSETVYHGLKRYSLMLTAGLVVGFVLLPEEAIHGPKPVAIPVERARISEKFLIDGDRKDMAVVFDHSKHKNDNGADKSCVLCHHMTKPLNKFASCADCHKDMYLDTDIFAHNLHQEMLNGKNGCSKCHTNPYKPKTREFTLPCNECHKQMRVDGTIIKISAETRENMAPGYKNAMHGLCISCHQKKSIELNKPKLKECSTCHKDLPEKLKLELDETYRIEQISEKYTKN